MLSKVKKNLCATNTHCHNRSHIQVVFVATMSNLSTSCIEISRSALQRTLRKKFSGWRPRKAPHLQGTHIKAPLFS